MSQPNIVEPQRAARALTLAKESFDIIFDRAPVMMHAVDSEFRTIKVNRRWLETIGYRRDEVLGWSPQEFVTEETRARTVKDILPRFWRTGSDRSIGLQFVRKDGRILDLLLDAEVSPAATGNYFAYAALHDSHDHIQWEQASTTIQTLQQLTRVQAELESILSVTGIAAEDAEPPAFQHSPDPTPQAGSAPEALGSLLELADDIPTNLRALLRVHEEWFDATGEQQRELLVMAKDINRTLADIADSLAVIRQASEELP